MNSAQSELARLLWLLYWPAAHTDHIFTPRLARRGEGGGRRVRQCSTNPAPQCAKYLNRALKVKRFAVFYSTKRGAFVSWY